jgi:hypothetical protein
MQTCAARASNMSERGCNACATVDLLHKLLIPLQSRSTPGGTDDPSPSHDRALVPGSGAPLGNRRPRSPYPVTEPAADRFGPLSGCKFSHSSVSGADEKDDAERQEKSARRLVERLEGQALRGAITLSGTLVMPSNMVAAVVLVDGSGKDPRNIPFARALARAGLATLTYDKRGVGKSGGVYAGPEVGTNNVDPGNLNLLAGDASAAQIPVPDGRQSGLLGSSHRSGGARAHPVRPRPLRVRRHRSDRFAPEALDSGSLAVRRSGRIRSHQIVDPASGGASCERQAIPVPAAFQLRP